MKNLRIYAGLGEGHDAPEQVVHSYREAESALQVGRRPREAAADIGDRVLAFSALGIQRLLFTLSRKSPEALRDFEESSIGAAVLYDERHGTELVKTLKAYTDCDGDISEAAGLLHVHKHTVRYRLRRVNELTGLNVTKFQDAAQLYLAVRAGELF